MPPANWPRSISPRRLGFDWLPMTKLEVQFYTLRHLQTHVGEVAERLSQRVDIDVGWVGMRA